MASKETPRSMMQAFIENVPTTAPIKRTRSRTRSPTNRQFNETVPVQKKRRKKSSFGVQQTPKSVIETYMHEHKTQTPFVRTLRRRSVSSVTMPPPKVQTTTPRTALEGFINEASEETPYQKPSKQNENSELENESDVELPNETIFLDQTPITNEDSGPVTLLQKESRRNQFRITSTQLSQGLTNFTTDRHNTEEKMFSSDDDSTAGNPTDISLNALADSLSSESDKSFGKSHTDRQQDSVAPEQFSEDVQNISVAGKTSSAMSNESTHSQNRATPLQNKSLYSQNKSKHSLNELVHSQNKATPMQNKSLYSQNKSLNESLHSQNKATPLQNESKHSLNKTPMQNITIHTQSKLMQSRSMRSPSLQNVTANKFSNLKPLEKTSMTENIQESEERLDIANDGKAINVKNQNVSRAKIIEDLTPSRRNSPSLVNTQKKTPLYSNVTILENIKPLSSSTPARIATNKSTVGTPLRVSTTQSNSTPRLTPRREPFKSALNNTPGRQITLSTPRQTPGRQAKVSTPRQTPGRQTKVSTPRQTPGRVSVLREGNVINRTSEKILTDISTLVNSNKVDPRDASNTYIEKTSNSTAYITPVSIQSSQTVSKEMDDNAPALKDQQEHEDTEDPDEEEDTTDLFQLKTPHLQGNISRIPTPIYSSTPAPDRHRQVLNPQPSSIIKTKSVKEQNARMVSSVLPNKVIKQAFQHFSKMRITPYTLDELIQFTDTYFKHTFKSLEMYATHAGRKSIDETDVELMMKRQGFISDKQPLDVLVENILPLELRQEIIPMATAYNIVIP